MSPYREIDANEDKPHRCPNCHRIPDEAYKDGVAIPGKTYCCDKCKVQWTWGK